MRRRSELDVGALIEAIPPKLLNSLVGTFPLPRLAKTSTKKALSTTSKALIGRKNRAISCP
jgi:hypothetical protein